MEKRAQKAMKENVRIKDLREIGKFMLKKSEFKEGTRTQTLLRFLARWYPSFIFYMIFLFAVFYKLGVAFLIYIAVWMGYYYRIHVNFVQLLLDSHMGKRVNQSNLSSTFNFKI